MKIKVQNYYYFFTISLALMIFIGNPYNGFPLLYSQDFVAEVKFVTELLPEEKKTNLRDLPIQLEEYINYYDYSQGELPYSIGCTIQIFFESVKSTFEDRYNARMFITTDTGTRYVDKWCRFIYNKGDIIAHDSIEFYPLLGFLDFYLYITLGIEMDRLGNYQGTKFFLKAEDIANLAKHSRFTYWWDNRLQIVRKLLDERHKPFRQMTAIFENAFYSLDNGNIKEALNFTKLTIQQLQSIMRNENEYEYCREFLDYNYNNLIELTKLEPGDELLDILIEIDPQHKDFYVEAKTD